MPSTAAQVIDRLNRQWDDEATNLVTSHEYFGVVSRHVEDEVSDSILQSWLRRGRKPSISGEGCRFHHADCPEAFRHMSKHSIDFNIGVSTLEKLVRRVITTIEPVLYMYSQLVKPIKMSGQVESGNTFANYPRALYATDVKYQPVYRPSGRYAEQKVYFSAMHKLYGFKIEGSVAPPGLAVDVSDLDPAQT
ncbi:unnamed protein product [Phytophthora fragariaefolia]|uniref:Unnamed protein product n=1 Tax=Phytophthora fragariaefolia TaxID=1490495 RepID=A0A9W6Y532_9STRA|nr:unnamed protein product [Phytophthora fragariaefolia]